LGNESGGDEWDKALRELLAVHEYQQIRAEQWETIGNAVRAGLRLVREVGLTPSQAATDVLGHGDDTLDDDDQRRVMTDSIWLQHLPTPGAVEELQERAEDLARVGLTLLIALSLEEES